MSDITIETTIDRWPAVRGEGGSATVDLHVGGEHVGAVHVGREVGERRWTSDEPAPLTGPLAGVDERVLASLTAWSLEALARRIVRACTWDLREASLREGHRRTDEPDVPRLMDAEEEAALAETERAPSEPGPLDPVVGVLEEGREVLCETLADAETVQEAAELCGVPVRVRTSSEGWIVRATTAAAGTSPAAEPTSPARPGRTESDMTETEGMSDQQARAAWVECRECGTLVDPATVGGPLGDARYDAEQGGYLDSDRSRLAGAIGTWPCVGCRTRAAYRRALIETRGDSEAARALVEADAARLADLPRVPAWA